MHYYSFPSLYELAFKLPPLLLWRKKSLNALTKSLTELKNTHPQTILDVGCGAGVLTKTLREIYPDTEILGIDKSNDMIGFAHKKHNKIAKFKQADFLTYEGKHDLVVSFYSFCFFPLKEGVEKIKHIINQKGTCIIVTCGKAAFSVPHKFFLNKITGSKIGLYSPEDFKQLLPASKFDVNSKIISKTEGSFVLVISAKKTNDK
ncbi:MAG: methyltransferase domain-containing protein [bacterium]|nr:methyltransferase domain-containing protein [bacterium]